MVTQSGETVYVRSDNRLNQAILGQIERVLALSESTLPLLRTAKRLSKNAHDLIVAGYGRMLRSPTLWEDLAKTLLTTNCNWRKTQNMVTGLCNALGVQYGSCKSFPSPQSIIKTPAKSLQACGLGYRTGYMIALAETYVNGGIERCEDDLATTQMKIDTLNSIRGFGPYSVAHALVLLGDYSRIPIDSDSNAYLRSRGLDHNTTQNAYSSWGKYRFWGYKLGRIARKLNWIGD